MNSTRERLESALERLIKGEPLNVSINRKISPAALEDEAGVGRSLLRNNPEYLDIFERTVEAKNAQRLAAKKCDSVLQKATSVDQDLRTLRADLKVARERIKELEAMNHKLIQNNAELTFLLKAEHHLKNIEEWSRSMGKEDVVTYINKKNQ